MASVFGLKFISGTTLHGQHHGSIDPYISSRSKGIAHSFARKYRLDEVQQARVEETFVVYYKSIDRLRGDKAGKVKQHRRVHVVPGNPDITEVYTHAYDHAERLLSVSHQLNGAPQVTLVQYTHDDAGRVKTTNQNTYLKNKMALEDLVFHDCKIYGIGFNTEKNELFIDIDFIEKWIHEKNSDYYSFIVFPATLIFENVWDLNMDISANLELIIDNIKRENPCIPRNIDYLPEFSKEYDWKIELINGEINFKSISMKIYQRGNKEKKNTQTFKMEDRGCITLEKKGVLYAIC